MKEEEYEGGTHLSRVERSLHDGYWFFPLEPTSEVCSFFIIITFLIN